MSNAGRPGRADLAHLRHGRCPAPHRDAHRAPISGGSRRNMRRARGCCRGALVWRRAACENPSSPSAPRHGNGGRSHGQRCGPCRLPGGDGPAWPACQESGTVFRRRHSSRVIRPAYRVPEPRRLRHLCLKPKAGRETGQRQDLAERMICTDQPGEPLETCYSARRSVRRRAWLALVLAQQDEHRHEPPGKDL